MENFYERSHHDGRVSDCGPFRHRAVAEVFGPGRAVAFAHPGAERAETTVDELIDGAKALRRAIDTVYGADNLVQRCRNHKRRNVRGHLPKELARQVDAVLRAAFRLEWQEGVAKIEQQTSWLEREHPSAAASLGEGLEELFTIDRLGLPATLRRALGTTNLIDSHSGMRERTNRVTHWLVGSMVQRWAASALLATEAKYRRIMGHQQLWMLKTHLDDNRTAQTMAVETKAG